MQHYRFIVRLLDAERRVLAWNQVFCECRGDGALRSLQDFLGEAQESGTATGLCVHWVDVNVHMTTLLPQPVVCDVGKVVSVPLRGLALFTLAGDTTELPAVTLTQSVHVAVGAYRA